MQIEAGKYYRTRGGWKAGPMRRRPEGQKGCGRNHEVYPWTDGDWIYTDEGRQRWDTREDGPRDLVAEWAGEPDTPETYVQPEDYAAVPVRDDSNGVVEIPVAPGETLTEAWGRWNASPAEVVRPFPTEGRVGGEWNASDADFDDQQIAALAAAAAPTPLIDAFDAALSKAANVTADRGKVYGHPYDDFGRATAIKAAVADCADPRIRHVLEMIAVKMARLVHSPDHLDSLIDIAGYARTGVMVLDRQQVKKP